LARKRFTKGKGDPLRMINRVTKEGQKKGSKKRTKTGKTYQF